MERPILFNTEMVQAILEGRKTQTRRIIKHDKHRPYWMKNFIDGRKVGRKAGTIWTGFYEESDVFYIDDEKHIDGVYEKQPYQVGDILYVRETYLKGDDAYHYKADETRLSKEIRESYGYKWHPSIHMPKVAARIFLKVADVKVERIQSMSFEDMFREGIEVVPGTIKPYPSEYFKPLWDDIYLKQGYGWDENPYVWVIEFERAKG